MNKKSNFIPYKQSVALIAIGYVEDAYGVIYPDEEVSAGAYKAFAEIMLKKDSTCVKAILYSEAFDWFRENHGLAPTIVPRSWEKDVIKWSIWGNNLNRHCFTLHWDAPDSTDNPHDSYRDAEFVALKRMIAEIKEDYYYKCINNECNHEFAKSEDYNKNPKCSNCGCFSHAEKIYNIK